jgi:hypothetical protein
MRTAYPSGTCEFSSGEHRDESWILGLGVLTTHSNRKPQEQLGSWGSSSRETEDWPLESLCGSPAAWEFACPWGTCGFSFRERRSGSWILGLGVLSLLDKGKNTLMRGCSSLWLGEEDSNPH